MEKSGLKNIFLTPEWDKLKEYYETLVERPEFRVEIIMSAGHTSPIEGWYNQNENEMVILLKGNAIIEFENNRKVEMNVGDILTIQSHERHKVTYTSTDPECVWIAIFWI